MAPEMFFLSFLREGWKPLRAETRRFAWLRSRQPDAVVGRHAFISLITPALFTKLLTEKGGLRKGLIFETLGPNATWRAPPGEAAGASMAGGALSLLRHRKAHRRIPLGWQTASSRTTACAHKSERRDPWG
jgi:hypothetical protein